MFCIVTVVQVLYCEWYVYMLCNVVVVSEKNVWKVL